MEPKILLELELAELELTPPPLDPVATLSAQLSLLSGALSKISKVLIQCFTSEAPPPPPDPL